MRLYYKHLVAVAFMSLLPVYAAAAQTLSKDSSKPIEITSDSLEVMRDKNIAIFTGAVEAIQGNVNLRSDKMIVHYRQGGQKTASNNSVSKIEVFGHVFLSTPEETAEGKEGVYDVDGKEVTLNNDVVVTKGKNIVKGDNLVYNLATGESRVWSQGKVNSASGKAKPGRVHSVFVPEEKKGNAGNK